jgi:hypothetical protein
VGQYFLDKTLPYTKRSNKNGLISVYLRLEICIARNKIQERQRLKILFLITGSSDTSGLKHETKKTEGESYCRHGNEKKEIIFNLCNLGFNQFHVKM